MGWADQTFAVLDVETTGVDPQQDRVVQLGVAIFRPGADKPEAAGLLVNPGVPIPPQATEVHRIADADVADAQPFGEVWALVAEDLAEASFLVAYNAPFDTAFLGAELERAGLEMSGLMVLDPLPVFREHYAPPHRLGEAYRRLGLGVLHGAHDACTDAWATGRVLLALRDKLPEDLSEAEQEVSRLRIEHEQQRAVWGRHFYVRNGRLLVGFGRKHAGREARLVGRGFWEWCLGTDGVMRGATPRAVDAMRALAEGREVEVPSA